MTYKLPPTSFSRNGHDFAPLYTAEQMQQAYAAGRESMREEAASAFDRTSPYPITEYAAEQRISSTKP